MKSLHKLNEIPPDMAPTSHISVNFQTANTTTSTGISSSAINDVLMYCKEFCCTWWPKKLETHFTNPDCQYLPHYISFELVGHSQPGLYKPQHTMTGLGMCLCQDHYLKFGTSLFLSLCPQVSPLWKEISLIVTLSSFTLHIETPPKVKKPVKNNKLPPEWKRAK